MCIDFMYNLTHDHITGLVSVFVCLSGYTNGRLLHPMLPGYNAVGRETLQAHADVRRPQMTVCVYSGRRRISIFQRPLYTRSTVSVWQALLDGSAPTAAFVKTGWGWKALFIPQVSRRGCPRWCVWNCSLTLCSGAAVLPTRAEGAVRKDW